MTDEQVVAIVEKLYDALGREDIETVLGIFDPEVVIHTPPSLPWSTGDYQGLEGAVKYFQGALEACADTVFDVEEIHPSGDWAAAIGDWSGTSRASGRGFRVKFVHFWTLRDGKIIKAEGISDTVEIVAAFD
ncbi:nuclear transport factor 2 family protein [Catenulispora rubra]|uniref:nuclear transport factor 2 family protein n=1 Tax=Catenulispora rubra TaxID=280293 RepID=UPI001892050E|nr:nuclear transport factor 2 family protein [Catenulispora rubra]